MWRLGNNSYCAIQRAVPCTMLGWASALAREARADDDRVCQDRRIVSSKQDGNARGVVYKAGAGRSRVVLASGVEVFRPTATLAVLPTSSLGLIIAGSATEAGQAFFKHVIETRERLLLERGLYLPLLALFGGDGTAVLPFDAGGDRHRPYADDFLKPCADAPHGGLSDASLSAPPAAISSGLGLPEVLQRSAAPGFVLVAFDDSGDESAPTRAQLERSAFSAAWCGGALVSVGSAEACRSGGRNPAAGDTNDCGWLRTRSLPSGTSTSAVLDAVLEDWHGWLPALTPAVDGAVLSACLTCGDGDLDDAALVCSACGAVSSQSCQLSPLALDRRFCTS